MVGNRGNYSGTLMINGAGHGFSGMFNVAGQATNRIHRPTEQGGPLAVEMNLLSISNAAPELCGSVIGSNNGAAWASPLLADRANVTTNSTNYTLTIGPDTDEPASNSIPPGDGYALFSDHHGTVGITGALADGTAFSQSVPASRAQDVPVYASLYGGKGVVLGWVNLATNQTGPLCWIHPDGTKTIFTNSFTNINPVCLSPWSNNPPLSALPTNLQLVITANGAAPQTNSYVLSIGTDYTLGGMTGPSDVSGSINPRTGHLTLTFGSGDAMVRGFGAVLLNSTNGAGQISTQTASGAILLNP